MSTTAPAPSAPPTSPAPPPAPDARAWLPRVIAESVLIVFSVLLALGVDEWREKSAHERQAAAARREILAELRANRDAVRESMRYHATVLDSLAAHRGDAGWTPPVRLFSRGFVSPAQFSHTAWSSASETGALTHMDYDAVLRYSRVYAQQDRYAEQTRAVSNLIYAELYRGGADGIASNHRNLAAIIHAFRFREAELLAVYDRTLSASPR